jgi:hypothetical protein
MHVRAFECVGARELACVLARVTLLIRHATLRHIVICGISGSTTFFDVVLHKWHDCRKKLLGVKCIYILICSTHFAWNISHYKNNSARYCHKCENVFMQIMHYSCRGLIKLEFSLQIFGRIFQVSKFNQNPSSRRRVVPCRRTDGQTRQS